MRVSSEVPEMTNTFFKKLKKRSGESLAETLIAALIAAVAMGILAGALVSSAKSNRAAKDFGSFAYNTEVKENQSAVFTTGTDSKGYTVDVYSKELREGDEIRKVYYYENQE